MKSTIEKVEKIMKNIGKLGKVRFSFVAKNTALLSVLGSDVESRGTGCSSHMFVEEAWLNIKLKAETTPEEIVRAYLDFCEADPENRGQWDFLCGFFLGRGETLDHKNTCEGPALSGKVLSPGFPDGSYYYAEFRGYPGKLTAEQKTALLEFLEQFEFRKEGTVFVNNL